MVTQQHMDLISKIYDLPLRPENWQPVLDEFSATVGAAGAALLAFDPVYAGHQLSIADPDYAGHHLSIVTSNFTPAIIEEFGRLYGAEDQKAYNSLLMNPKRGFISDMEALGFDSIDQVISHPPLVWLNEKLGIQHRAISCLNLAKVWTDILTVQYSGEHGPITDEERDTGLLFLSHFAKSVELGRAFSMLKSRFDGVLTALDRFHIGIFVLSPNGSVIVKNAEADRLLDAADGITLSRAGQLHPTGDSERAELKDAIIKAVHTAEAKHNRAESLLTLSRRSGDEPYLVEVAPIRDQGEIKSLFSGALVFVIDPTKTDVVSTEGMQTLYSLTPSESEVCKLLAEGYETDAIADTQNLTRGTVRFYIKQLFQKTGVNNRSQLVRRALNVNLPIDPASQEN